jgi:hypothetical protein
MDLRDQAKQLRNSVEAQMGELVTVQQQMAKKAAADLATQQQQLQQQQQQWAPHQPQQVPG